MDHPAPVLLLAGPGTDLVGVAAELAADSILTTGDPAGPAGGRVGPPLVASVHAAVLSSDDRDWTCPPAEVAPDPGAVEVLAAMHDQVVGAGGRWLVAEPGTAFLLPIWVEVAPRLELVVVDQDLDVAVAALVGQGLARAEADDLVRAHAHRLEVLRDRLDLPVIDLTATTAARCEAIHATRAIISPDPDGSAAGVAADAVLDAVAAAVAGHPSLVRTVGPQAARRRAAAWSAVPVALRPAVEVCRRARVAVDRVVAPDGAVVVEAADLGAVHTGLRAAREALGGPPAVAVLSDALAWVGPDDLEGLFATVRAHLDVVGLLVLHRSPGDVEEAARRGRHVDDSAVATAGAAAGLALVDHRDGPGGAGRWRFVVDLDDHARAADVDRRLAAGGRIVHVDDLAAGDLSGGLGVDGARGPIDLQATGPPGDWQLRYERLRNRRSVALTLRAVDLARSALGGVRGLGDRVGRG